MACVPSVFGPLSFPEPSPPPLPFGFTPWEQEMVSCMLCPAQFPIPLEKEYLLAHLYTLHKIIVADIDLIASIKGYLDYWRVRLSQVPVQNVCTTMRMEDEDFYLLSDVNPEDRELRCGLTTKRLEWVLECQRREREEGHYERGCLFCRFTEQGTRADYVNHLAYQHNLQLGRPDNIVFIDKLIDKIEEKLLRLECIYCEHIFKDRDTLKEHMRKKFHKRINPKNKEYDRFYVKSYIENGSRSNEAEDGDCDDSWSQWREEGSDWSDWQEEPSPIVCLFCSHTCREWDNILAHMRDAHRFSYKFVMGSYCFYEQLKIVNFIRREVHLLRCYECKLKFPDRDSLAEHMTMACHCNIPDRSDWDHPDIVNLPYRTTPLVLPGAKAKHEKELAPTESYLRHHPNPGMRAPPPQHIFLPQDVLMKQKVVHKQFNTPIGLYSEQNISDTIHHQTGVTPHRIPSVGRPGGRSIGPKKTIVYDPAKSETFKALQEEKFGEQVQEVVTPVQPRVFTPNAQPVKAALQPPQTHTYDPLSRSSASPSQHHVPYVNSMGHSDEHIAQSGSFKRLMNLVMGESEF